MPLSWFKKKDPQPFMDEDERKEYEQKVREDIEKEMRGNIAKFVDLQSLFAETEPPSIIVKYGAIVLNIIVLGVLIFKH